jgi:hypothetical protein
MPMAGESDSAEARRRRYIAVPAGSDMVSFALPNGLHTTQAMQSKEIHHGGDILKS